jgi:hypothetical protein
LDVGDFMFPSSKSAAKRGPPRRCCVNMRLMAKDGSVASPAMRQGTRALVAQKQALLQENPTESKSAAGRVARR